MTRASQIRADLQRALADPGLPAYERDEVYRDAMRQIEAIRIAGLPKVKRRRPLLSLAAQALIVTAFAIWFVIGPLWRWATGENRDGFYIAITAIGTAAVVYGRIMGVQG